MSDLIPPPFLFTYWNPFSKDSSLVDSWFSYVKDRSLANYTADSVGRYMEQVSGEQIHAIHATGRKICGAIYDGMHELQNQLGSVQGQLENVQSQLGNVQGQLRQVSGQVYQVCLELQGVNQRLGLLVDEARTSNILQENIAELLRIPDSQKQRQHHLELGLKFLKNARMDEDLYQDALSELLEAEKLMPTDYFVLHRIGLIYLYAPALGNLEKALDHFVRAAKYAVVESHPDASRLNNFLSKTVNTRFTRQTESSHGNVGALAAESYHEAGTVLYALGRYEEAVSMAEKAVKRREEVGTYSFFLAKYLTRAGKTDSAVQHLQRAVELAPEMALAAVGDFDLNQSQPVLDLLEALNKKVDSQLYNGIERLQKWADSESLSGDTDVPEWITNAEENLQSGSYLEKRKLATRLADYDDATLAVLPACSKVMQSLDNTCIGQTRIKMRIVKAAQAADSAMREHVDQNDKRRVPPLGHILLTGPVGMGKSTLVRALAEKMQVNLFDLSPSKIRTGGEFAGLVTTLDHGDILVVEEIDKLPANIGELLCMAAKGFAFDLLIDQGSNARSVRISTPRFTLIATTSLSLDQLPFEWLSVFSIVECMDPYSPDEQIKLAQCFASQLGIDPEAAVKGLDSMSKSTPRDIYKGLLRLDWPDRRADHILAIDQP